MIIYSLIFTLQWPAALLFRPTEYHIFECTYKASFTSQANGAHLGFVECIAVIYTPGCYVHTLLHGAHLLCFSIQGNPTTKSNILFNTQRKKKIESLHMLFK